jgi:hypothetical protein
MNKSVFDFLHLTSYLIGIGRARWRAALVHVVCHGFNRYRQYWNVCNTCIDADLGF